MLAEMVKKKGENKNKGLTSICFDCKKACGDCSWSAYDPVAGTLKWEPVEGWVAEPVLYPPSAPYQKPSWRVIECPEFEPDGPTMIIADRYCEMCGEQIVGERIGSRCHCFKCVPKYHFYDRTTGEVRMLQKYRKMLERAVKHDG